MNLCYDHSHGAANVRVHCLNCDRGVWMADAIIDLDGPQFQAYYCRPCLATKLLQDALPETCAHEGCLRKHKS